MPVSAQVQYYLNAKLTATGASALPYDERLKFAVRDQLLAVVERYPSLSVRDDPFTHNDGRTVHLLRAEGTIPIYYMGVKYNIPLKMFLPEAFPHAQPICYVTPTSNMIIKPGHSCVDGSGLVRSPYGDRWSYPRSNLTELAGLLSEAFGSEPPLFAKPAGYVPPPPRTSPHVLAGGLSVAEGTFKARAITALSDRLRSELDVLRAQSGEEAERLLTLQAELARRREDIERSLREMRAERGAWEHRIGGMQAATVALEEWVSENEGKRKETEIADAAFRPEDPLSEQILEEMAKDLALEDAMDCLDEALSAKQIELEPYLELIRELSKEQFFARATTMVARKEQRERGVSQGVTF
ncbi:predicted protein [Micromonas commoda]|uniref:UEV domain-containing protein n=1 Tax=Micromonas commoda (strain RCC299 / NOUM17 / CCMP2709) TaxID=296587 RepID=C1E1D0_MICCC|nr:predicted protein [Micromonas commoda]ACO61715.1 predicted protein [Micromonas commoda]|eukprot:XP_002500457.1 predicted protein [Micromonas commoda]